MGFEVEIGPQEISTQSGKKTYIVKVVCVWLGNFLLREFFFTRAFLATYVAFAATGSVLL